MTTDADIQNFFINLRDINKEHLKPSDIGYKLFEEYKQENDFTTIDFLRDAYILLIRAIKSGDMNLDEYANMLMKARLRTIIKLIIARIIDLVTSGIRIILDDKENIKKQLQDMWQNLSDLRNNELDAPISNARLKELIEEWEEKRDKIEGLCQKYNMGDIDALRQDARHGG